MNTETNMPYVIVSENYGSYYIDYFTQSYDDNTIMVENKDELLKIANAILLFLKEKEYA